MTEYYRLFVQRIDMREEWRREGFTRVSRLLSRCKGALRLLTTMCVCDWQWDKLRDSLRRWVQASALPCVDAEAFLTDLITYMQASWVPP